MVLRYIDRKLKDGNLVDHCITPEFVLGNHHPAAVDYLIRKLQAKKLSRKYCIENANIWLMNENTDMVRFGRALALTEEETDQIIDSLLHENWGADSGMKLQEQTYRLFKVEILSLLCTYEEVEDEEVENDDEDSLVMKIIWSDPGVGFEDEEIENLLAALIVLVQVCQNDTNACQQVLDVFEMHRAFIIDELSDENYQLDAFRYHLSQNSNNVIVDYLLNHRGMIHLQSVAKNKNIRMFHFVRDHILPHLDEFREQLVFPLDDEIDKGEENIWVDLILRRDEHKEIAKFVNEAVKTWQFSKPDLNFPLENASLEKVNYDNPFLTTELTKKSPGWGYRASNPHLFDYDYESMRKTRHRRTPFINDKNDAVAHISVGEGIQAHFFRPPRISPRGATESPTLYRRRLNRTLRTWNKRLDDLGHSPVIENDEEWEKQDAAKTITRAVWKKAAASRRKRKKQNAAAKTITRAVRKKAAASRRKRQLLKQTG
jgi:hypothetical protein